MKKEVYKSEFVEYDFDEENSILFETWSSAELNEKIFKEEQMHKKELLERHQPKHILDNISQTDFTISTELQSWSEELFVPILMGIGTTKYAIVVPESIFGQVSMEQTIEEVEQHNIDIEFQYFDSEEDAVSWLKS
jgi:hypothetical protein